FQSNLLQFTLELSRPEDRKLARHFFSYLCECAYEITLTFFRAQPPSGNHNGHRRIPWARRRFIGHFRDLSRVHSIRYNEHPLRPHSKVLNQIRLNRLRHRNNRRPSVERLVENAHNESFNTAAHPGKSRHVVVNG